LHKCRQCTCSRPTGSALISIFACSRSDRLRCWWFSLALLPRFREWSRLGLWRCRLRNCCKFPSSWSWTGWLHWECWIFWRRCGDICRSIQLTRQNQTNSSSCLDLGSPVKRKDSWDWSYSYRSWFKSSDPIVYNSLSWRIPGQSSAGQSQSGLGWGPNPGLSGRTITRRRRTWWWGRSRRKREKLNYSSHTLSSGASWSSSPRFGDLQARIGWRRYWHRDRASRREQSLGTASCRKSYLFRRISANFEMKLPIFSNRVSPSWPSCGRWRRIGCACCCSFAGWVRGSNIRWGRSWD
jgi:hypothetical protein